MENEDIYSKVVHSNNILEQLQEVPCALAMIEQLRGGMAVRAPREYIFKIIDGLLREIPYFRI